MQRRRDFLKLLAASTGGVMLSSCGSSGGDSTGGPGGGLSGSNGPNGYRFIPLLDSGSALPGSSPLQALPGGVLINGAGQILFYGESAEGVALYELTPDYVGLENSLKLPESQVRRVVGPGDTLADGSVVQAVGTAVSNRQQTHAMVLSHDGKTRSIFMQRSGAGLEKVSGFRTLLPGPGGIRLGGILGDLDLNDQNDLLLVDHYTRAGRVAPGQGLFYLPGGRVGPDTRLLMSTEELVPDSRDQTTAFGLVDLNSLGHYVAHVVGSAPFREDLPPAQGLFFGLTNEPLSRQLLTGPASFNSTNPGTSRFFSPGSSIFGARLGETSENVAHILHESQDRQSLYVNERRIASVGDRSLGGSTIRGFSGPVLQPDGAAVFGVAITEDGHELSRVSTTSSQLLLSRGDPIGSRQVNSIIFGLHSDQVDRMGRLVFIGEFMDGSSSVVLGLPV